MSLDIVKTLIIKYGIHANIFAEYVGSFCKNYSHFFSKYTCELNIVHVLTRTLNILTTNELVKLTML